MVVRPPPRPAPPPPLYLLVFKMRSWFLSILQRDQSSLGSLHLVDLYLSDVFQSIAFMLIDRKIVQSGQFSPLLDGFDMTLVVFSVMIKGFTQSHFAHFMLQT